MTTELDNLPIDPDEYIIDPADQVWLKERIDNLTFGSMVRSFRLCEEWTQAETAAKLGVSKEMLSQLENGKRLPSPEKAVEIAEILGIGAKTALFVLINQQLKKANLPYRVERLAS